MSAASENGDERLSARAGLLRLARRWWPRAVSSRYFLAGAILAIFMLVFFAARVALLVVYYRIFSILSFGETLFAFWRGALFDASIILMYAGLPLLALVLPFDWAASKWTRRVCGWLLFTMLVVFAFVLAGDVVYFEEVERHAGPETWAVGNDLIILFRVALEHWLALIVLVSGVACAGWGWSRLLRRRPAPIARKWLGAAADFAILAVMVLTVRGGVTHKPLNIVNAFEDVRYTVGLLVLNGPFSLNHSMRSSYQLNIGRYPRDEAFAEVRRLVASKRERFLDGDYPLLRERAVRGPHGALSRQSKGKAEAKERPNVVVILLESWGAERVDCLRRRMGRKPHGATSEFDALSEDGALFTRFYGTGQRSVHGIAAILAGVPTIPGMPYMGLGMEQNRLAYLGRIAGRAGYSTYFLQASPRHSYRCEAISSMAGFDGYFGEEDIPLTGHAGGKRHSMGAWDYDLFMKAHDLFAAAEKPFMGFVFTLTTHGPYQVPAKKWLKRPTNSRVKSYLNTLEYSDWALGEFFRKAKEAGYFENTIFVITADHSGGRCGTVEDVPSGHRIPLLIVGPGVEPGVRDALGSQTDLFPTIMDLAGLGGRHATLGRSLFDEIDETAEAAGARRFALMVRGEMVVWVEEGGWVFHSFHRRLSARRYRKDADLDAIERRMLSAVQVVTIALRENRVFKPEGP